MVSESVRRTKAQWGILFELETVAVKGRKLMFEVWKKIMATREAELDSAFFCRYCLNDAPTTFLPVILQALGKSRFSPDRILAEYTEGIAEAFAAKAPHPEPGTIRLFKSAGAQNAAVGASSGLNAAAAAALLKSSDLSGVNLKHECFPSADQIYPTAETWSKLAHHCGLAPRRCVALVSSAGACRAALAAGMRCIGVPDEFTAYQDFGGADFLVDKLDERVLRDVTTLMRVKPA